MSHTRSLVGPSQLWRTFEQSLHLRVWGGFGWSGYLSLRRIIDRGVHHGYVWLKTFCDRISKIKKRRNPPYCSTIEIKQFRSQKTFLLPKIRSTLHRKFFSQPWKTFEEETHRRIKLYREITSKEWVGVWLYLSSKPPYTSVPWGGTWDPLDPKVRHEVRKCGVLTETQ